MESHLDDDKLSLSQAELDAGILPYPAQRAFVVQMLLIYKEAAALQYEEAERLMDVALAAKAHADALLNRCADLVAENLTSEGTWAEVLLPDMEEDPIPW